MDKANLNFSNCDNTVRSICWIFSVLGWLMYIICGWISLKWINGKYPCSDGIVSSFYSENLSFNWRSNILDYFNCGYVMTILRRKLIKVENFKGKWGDIYPLQMQTAVLYIVIIITMLFALVGFIVYMIKSTCKKCDVFEKMMDFWTRLHSIPLFIAAGLFLVGICYVERKNSNWEDANIAGCVLVILGLASLIFIYIKTKLPGDWLTATIKKGAYSTLIALEWYYFCYLICNLALIDHSKETNPVENAKKRLDDLRGCGIAMPIIEGVGALLFAFFFKDVIIAFMNVLIFIGAAAYYLSINSDLRKKEYGKEFGFDYFKGFGGNGDAEGIIDIIFMVLSIVVIVLLIILRKKECLE